MLTSVTGTFLFLCVRLGFFSSGGFGRCLLLLLLLALLRTLLYINGRNFTISVRTYGQDTTGKT